MNTILFGKPVAESIFSTLSFKQKITLGVYIVGNNEATLQYVRLKQKYAKKLGINLVISHNEIHESQKRLVSNFLELQDSVDVIIVQLPLPNKYLQESILAKIDEKKDVDCLSQVTMTSFKNSTTNFIPPVAGAIFECCEYYNINIAKETIALVGEGKLVGGPTALYLTKKSIPYTIFEKGDNLNNLKKYSMIISGTGVGHCIKKDMIQEGVILIDAGTSNDTGELKGDIDPLCFPLARAYTPVPKGIGPITMAVLFRNIVTI